MGGYALAAAGVASAAGSLLGGKAKKDAANTEANNEIEDARLKAQRIRQLAGETRSEATAAYAASGVDVSQGTPLISEREITRRSEEDALFTILGANRTARAIRKTGKAQQTASYFDAASSLLSAGADYAGGGWKRAAGGSGA